MPKFNLEDYEPVEERLKRFYKDYPEGRVVTEMVFDDGVRVMFKAYLYKTFKDEKFWSTGYAEERKDDGKMVNDTSRVENCETSAIGRALANANYSGDKRPSREEMVKVVSHKPTIRPKEYRTPVRLTKDEADFDEDDLVLDLDDEGFKEATIIEGKLVCGCGREITDNVKKYSIDKYGKPACMVCQKKFLEA